MPNTRGFDQLRVTILGRVRIVADEQTLTVPRAQARGLLALLALHHGQSLSGDAIIESMWAGNPPEKARGQVHSAMSVIRAVLTSAGHAKALDSNRFGYRLAVAAGNVDVGDFGRLAAAAKQQPDDARAVRLWRQALALFQGEPLADAAGAYVLATRSGIDERRLAAIEDLADTQLRLGQHADVASELLPVLAAHPHRERLRGRVMLALHGSGRQAEALALYHSYRRELSERLGLDPGEELAELAVHILRAPATATKKGAPPGPAASPSRAAVPAMLPAGGRVFCGREPYLARLDELAGAGGVVAIDGAAGIGKTELVLHWAHRTHHVFPDGHLYVNLRGHTPAAALAPMEALGRLIFGLGMPPATMPSNLDDAVGLYRSLMAGRRLLVLLDNAGDADQVRPLLPGQGKNLVLVTGRAPLSGLAVSHGAHMISLGVLEPVESRELLRALLGSDAPASGELAELCDGLPLALRIAAARIAGRHPLTVAQYVEDARSGRALTNVDIPGDEAVAATDSDDERRDTLSRLVIWYLDRLHTARGASDPRPHPQATPA